MKIFTLLFLFFFTTPLFAQEAKVDSLTSNPLEHFDFLVGGTWTSNTTQQTFAWGIGKKSIISKLYFINTENNDLKLVGEINWFWHPGLEQIKGYGTSIDMAMDFFDYTTTFENPNKMLNTFMAYGGEFNGVQQLETLEFIDTNKYKWTYFNKVMDEFRPSYSITFQRK